MSAITDVLRNAAPRNKQLLEILSNTDHAAEAIEQQKRYLADLEVQIRDVKRRVGVLGHEKFKERKDHEKYRDSVMKRFAYKVSGKREKFAAKAEKEEKEYYEALEKLHQATTQRDELLNMKEEGLRALSDLEGENARHQEAQKELDMLYASIFEGPTPNFPEEDEMERRMGGIMREYNIASSKLEQDRQVQRLLDHADKRIKESLACIEDALDYSRWDMFGGGSATDMMERNALHKAEMELIQAQLLVTQAQHFSPDVRNLPSVNVASGSLMSDILFDNIFTDMEFHDKIKQSRLDIERCRDVLSEQLEAARRRCQASERKAKTQSDLLKNAREELQTVRQRIFETPEGVERGSAAKPSTTQPIPSENPPPYSES
ncbi:hypothetical protein GGS20DRAFT_394421 [Poronia punctata]|nr:hypothetical protein GGS20DRAFT_394421 [Poronia punctata]